eukprot:14734350-Alexandrium_andersonii.AAC.1
MGPGHIMYAHEGNQAMLAVARWGRNPAMPYLHRTHRAPGQWLRARFALYPDNVKIYYGDSADLCADIYIKAFDDALK